MSIEKLSDATIQYAARRLREGELVAFPTETVYGLGADATNGKAVAGIFALKGRPHFNPLIVHVDSSAMAQHLVVWNSQAEQLANAFWPGPLTLVLSRTQDSPLSLLASAGGDTIGVRMAAHAAARALITAAGIPIAAPSANRSGRISPTSARHVEEELGEELLILDGGACEVGIESTVLDISGGRPLLLRPGFVTQAQLENILGVPLASYEGQPDVLKSPGLLQSHYAPTTSVRLNVLEPFADEAFLAFGPKVPKGAKRTINLSAKGNLAEAAAALFAALRALDTPEFAAIGVMPIPRWGLGVAINDRLTRAATR